MLPLECLRLAAVADTSIASNRSPPTGWACGVVALAMAQLPRDRTVELLTELALPCCLRLAVQVTGADVADLEMLAQLGAEALNAGRAEDAVVIAERILTAVSAPIFLDGRELVVTGNIGMSIFPNDGESAKPLIRRAYAAMCRAREKGRNVYRFYSSQLNDRAFSRLLMENSLRIALQRGEFFLHYQPQLCLKTGQIVGLEALARWRSPKGEAISPSRFIPLAEETGLILPIGEWILRQVLMHQKSWKYRMSVALNISAAQFDNRAATIAALRAGQYALALAVH